jgi:ribosomal protection tetracycline resistance protein
LGINLGILAHVDAGKTTLTERMLHLSGAIRKIGSVDGGDAHTDNLDVERARGISVRASSAQFVYKGAEFNLIDTPGHADFSGEIERSLRALDYALLIVSAAEGVQAQTEAVWQALSALRIPTFFFVNKLDRTGADLEKVVEQIKIRLNVNPLVLPDEVCYTNTLILEAIAENNLEFLEIYINGKSLPLSEVIAMLRAQFSLREIFPLASGSALRGEGVERLMDWLIGLAKPAEGDPDGPLSALVYRVEHHPTLGKLAHTRLFGGKVAVRGEMENSGTGVREKVSQIKKYTGVKLTDAPELTAGQTGVILGLAGCGTGDIYGDASKVPGGYKLTQPLITVRVMPSNEQEYPRLLEVTQLLSDEDPLLNMSWVKEQRELVLSVTGLIQIEILEQIYKSRFGLAVTFGSPTVIYRETPSREAIGFEAYTMPKPCWAIIKLLITPLPQGSGVVYESKLNPTVLQPRYQAQIAQAIPEALRQGIRGFEVTDAHIELVDGQSHVYHTHPLDFIVATPMALMNGLAAAGTDLLEPYMAFTLTVPEELSSKILGEITLMRGRYHETDSHLGAFTVRGEYPLAEALDFPVRVAVLTSGRGKLEAKFSHYEKAPAHVTATQAYRGISPLDRAKYILHIRHAL